MACNSVNFVQRGYNLADLGPAGVAELADAEDLKSHVPTLARLKPPFLGFCNLRLNTVLS
jgi:hypothetical protein